MPANDLALLVEAAREAGEIALRHWKTDQTVWHKADDAGPVSEGDLAVDRHLRTRLTAARPDYGWSSEETEDDPASRLAAERVFVCDPIDGTRAYVEGGRSWAISLALVDRGRPVAGVVHLPARELMFAASDRGKATLNGRPIAASGRDSVESARILAPRAAADPANWQAGSPPPFARHFRPSLAYRLCLVAEGRYDGMLTLRPTWEWDIAAGSLIASRAGARVTDGAGRRLRFNTEDRLAAGVIAAGPALHAPLLAARAR